mgnify:CR=1 FL=1
MTLKDKMKQYNFWISLVSACLLVARIIAHKFNYEIDSSLVMDVTTGLCGIFVILGIISAPQKVITKIIDSTTSNVEAKHDLATMLGVSMPADEKVDNSQAANVQTVDMQTASPQTTETQTTDEMIDEVQTTNGENTLNHEDIQPVTEIVEADEEGVKETIVMPVSIDEIAAATCANEIDTVTDIDVINTNDLSGEKIANNEVCVNGVTTNGRDVRDNGLLSKSVDGASESNGDSAFKTIVVNGVIYNVNSLSKSELVELLKQMQ